MTTSSTGRRTGSGRPPKYQEPSRPVTVTLPVSTLDGLSRIDSDRSRAIVRVTEKALKPSGEEPVLAEIVKVVPETGLLIVGPNSVLPRIPFIRLIEVAPERFLIALEVGHDFKSLELALLDIVNEIPDAREHQLVGELLEHIRNLRKSDRVRMGEILFVKI